MNSTLALELKLNQLHCRVDTLLKNYHLGGRHDEKKHGRRKGVGTSVQGAIDARISPGGKRVPITGRKRGLLGDFRKDLNVYFLGGKFKGTNIDTPKKEIALRKSLGKLAQQDMRALAGLLFDHANKKDATSKHLLAIAKPLFKREQRGGGLVSF